MPMLFFNIFNGWFLYFFFTLSIAGLPAARILLSRWKIANWTHNTRPYSLIVCLFSVYFVFFWFRSSVRCLFVCLLSFPFLTVCFIDVHFGIFNAYPHSTPYLTPQSLCISHVWIYGHEARKFLDESALILFFKFEIEKHLVSRHFSSH